VTDPGRATTAAIRQAALVAGGMIAFQVGSKATRDALFLSNFDVTQLPAMIIAASFVALATAFAASRAMTRLGPARVVPLLFAASALFQLVEWAAIGAYPRVVAIAVYLHFNAVGALLISGFWSVLNERFDPRTAKRVVGPVGAAGTIGGLAGGILAERVAAHASLSSMLPLLGAMHLACAVLVLGLHDGGRRARAAERSPAGAAVPAPSGVRVLTGTAYLRILLGIVLLATIAEGALDYVFKAEARAAYGRGESLLRLFAVFYTGVALLSVVVQSALARRALERLGLARTAGVLPWTVAVGGGAALAAPGLAGAMFARGVEAIVRNSLYRASYELLFAPLPPPEKRAAKPLVDVGVVRLGDALAAGLVQLALLLAPRAALTALLVLAVVAGAAAIALTFDLHAGYVSTLEKSLVHRAGELDLDHVEDATTRSTLMHTTIGVVGSVVVPVAAVAEAAGVEEPPPAPPPAPEASAVLALRQQDPLLARAADLRSRDPDVVRAAIAAGPLDATLAAHVIPLLAWDAVAPEVLVALKQAAPRITGQLADALLDQESEFAVRRRISAALVEAGSDRALVALLGGLEDRRFEVRFRCGRALLRLTAAHPELRVSAERVTAAVLREVAVDREVWQSQRLLDRPDDDEAEFVDAVLRDRASRSLEHVFTMLALILPRQPLQIAFRALHTTDPQLRGTALEYLDTALPAAVREKLWPFLDDQPARAPASPRPREVVIADLLKSNDSIALSLEALRRRASKG
jgi:hypothetical protein